ncbi:MAG: 50S ribosomal protein L25 [Actinomycetota bacterium]
MEVTITAQARTETGKGAARRARARGSVPAVLYGPSVAAIPLLVDAREIGQVLHTEAGANVLINLRVDGAGYLTMLREIQRNPVRGDLIHIDFVNIARDVKVHADVPVHLVGESHGVKAGGVTEHHLWELKINALPGDVPPNIEVDLGPLGIGEHIRVADIVPPPGVEILTHADEIVVSVVEPQILELPEEVPAAEAEEAAAEAAEAEEAEGTTKAE